MQYNGYGFRENSIRKSTKYIVIYDGDLDLNCAYGLDSDIELEQLIKEWENDGSIDKIQAIFKIETDVTSTLI